MSAFRISEYKFSDSLMALNQQKTKAEQSLKLVSKAEAIHKRIQLSIGQNSPTSGNV